jgi:hypothetical protein
MTPTRDPLLPKAALLLQARPMVFSAALIRMALRVGPERAKQLAESRRCRPPIAETDHGKRAP